MQRLKPFLITLVVIFLLTTCIGLLMPSNVVVSRAINIHANKDSVFAELNDLKNWPVWMVGVKGNGFTVVSEKSIGAGAKANLNSFTITVISVDDKKIQSDWISPSGYKQHCVLSAFSDSTNITTVHWEFQQKVNWYPWSRIGAMSNEKMLGPVMEQSLDTLKVLLEKR